MQNTAAKRLSLANRSDANVDIPQATIEKLESHDPLTGEVWATYEEHTPKEVCGIIDELHTSYLEFSKLDMEERIRILQCCAKSFRDPEYFETMERYVTRERGGFIYGKGRGKPEQKGTMVEFMVDETVALALENLKPRQLKSGVERYDPMGIIFTITPWNAPDFIMNKKVCVMLACGNVCLVKPSPQCYGLSLHAEKFWKRGFETAGYPHLNLFRVVKMSAHRTEEVVADPRIRGGFLTGSVRAGRQFAMLCGKYLKKVVCELGGSDGYLILDGPEGELKSVAEFISMSRLMITGQVCVSPKRLITLKRQKESFINHLVAAVKEKKFMVHYHTLARPAIKDMLVKQVNKAIENGAQLIYGDPNGGDVRDHMTDELKQEIKKWNLENGVTKFKTDEELMKAVNSSFYAPVVLTNITKGNPAYEEEFFGPVFIIIDAESEQNAIEISNDSIFGLGGGVYVNGDKSSENTKKSTDPENFNHAVDIAKQLDTGMVKLQFNEDPAVPQEHTEEFKDQIGSFGGVKASGIGRANGKWGLMEWVNIKNVVYPGEAIVHRDAAYKKRRMMDDKQ